MIGIFSISYMSSSQKIGFTSGMFYFSSIKSSATFCTLLSLRWCDLINPSSLPGIHLSFQILIIFPSSTLFLTPFSSNFLHCSILYHIQQSYDFFFIFHIGGPLEYLAPHPFAHEQIRICNDSPELFSEKRLKSWKSLSPSPPFPFASTRSSHLIQCNFLSYSVAPH